MAYDPNTRSILESRFERLFEETFYCPIETLLTPQFKVDYKGRWYRIDYAYVSSNIKIAIELDGRSKFKDKEYYNYFWARHKALVASDFIVYHFTWDEVTENDGTRAKTQLMEIFIKVIKDKECANSTARSSTASLENHLNHAVDDLKRAIAQGQVHQQANAREQILVSKSEWDKLSCALKDLQNKMDEQGRGKPAHQDNSPKEKSTDNEPSSTYKKPLKIFSLCLATLIVFIAFFSVLPHKTVEVNKEVLESPPSSSPSVGNKTPAVNQGHAKKQESHSNAKGPKIPPSRQPKAVTGDFPGKVKPVPHPPAEPPQSGPLGPIGNSTQSQDDPPFKPPLEPEPPPVGRKPHEQELSADSIVFFNEETVKYHKPNCPVARHCKSCIPMMKVDAEAKGGTLSRKCYFGR